MVDSVDTGKSKFDKEGSSGEYPILGSTSVIGYDDEYDYEGDFILSARVGANAGSLYRHAGKVKISDNTVFIQASQNIEFLYQLLIRFDIKRLSFGTGQPLVKASELKRLELMMPTDMEEQIRIGVYFKNLDHLITLHQRKYLQKKKTSLTWEQRKLLSCIQSITDFRGRTPKKLGMDWSESGYLALSALNVKDGYIDFSQDVHYGNQELYDKWMSGKELHRGQVLFTTEAPMGNVAQVPDNKGYILSQRTIAFDVEEKILSENFLATLLRTPNVFNDLIALSSGGTAKGVSQKSLSGLDVVIPKNIDEQNKLADYFINLDNLITLHQRKCDQMKELKKYMLKKMFPQNGAKVPEIRFDGFTDDWEQRKLGDLVGIYDGVHQTPEYQDSGIMFLSVENIATLKSEKYISKEAFERDYKVYPEKGDILMTRIGDVGTTNVVETAKKVAFYVSLALLKPNGINSYFLSNAMKTNAFQKGLRERTLVTAIPQKINKDEIGKIDIFITNNDVEQQKIGAYFSTLDHLITLHRRAHFHRRRRTYK